MKYKLLILLFCLNSISSLCFEDLRFENISSKNGLSHNTVRHIMQDDKGFIWISTINGLNRYDGKEFFVLLPEFARSSLTEGKLKYTIKDNNGYIWILSTTGIVDCYDTGKETFIDYSGKDEIRRYLNIKVLKNGEVWFYGNNNGACRIQHDGKQLIPTFYDKENIKTNVVNFVFEDSYNQVWIGTDKDLYKISKGILEYCITGDDNINFHSPVELGDYIYFFSNNNKIIVFDKHKKKYAYRTKLFPERNSLSLKHTVSLKNDEILIVERSSISIFNVKTLKLRDAAELFGGEKLENISILTDNKKGIWLYNKSGYVWQYRKKTETFQKINLIPTSILSLIDLERYNIYCDSRNIIWITTYGNGLFAINQNTGNIDHFTSSNSKFQTDYLLTVTEDNQKNIWVGTENTGMVKISVTNHKDRLFFPENDKTDYGDKIIRTVYEDKKGDIWIGTKNGHIYVFDKELNKKHTFTLNKGTSYCIIEDTLGFKWVGTKGAGLLILSDDIKVNKAFSQSSTRETDISSINIYSMLEDNKGNIWIGTFGGGLLLCQRASKGDLIFKRYPSLSATQKFIRCMIQDDSGLIWVGGNNGIIVFDPDKINIDETDYRYYYFDKNDPGSLNNNEVKAFYEDSEKNIWIGTSGGGLNLAMKDSVEGSYYFKHYTSEDGLINNVIQSLEEDNNKNLWISTEGGISKLNYKNKNFENYNFSDEWESNFFCESSSIKKRDGQLLFGSYNGLHIIDPANFVKIERSHDVTLTRFRINGLPVTPGGKDSPLTKSITETEKIKLKDGQNSFSIEFSLLSFVDSDLNRYSYILENYDKDWNPVSQYNVAAYKNIPAGKYVFRVKGCNSSGVWSKQETLLHITIIPPFWKSKQAIILYIALFLIVGIIAFRLVIKMNKLHNDVEVEKQLTEYRLRFFTNISHEFRTPLTIIRGSIESLNELRQLPGSVKNQIKILDKSSSRLMRLIDQLLEFRKLQKDHLELVLEYTETISFFYEIYSLFSETAEKKKINYSFVSDKISQDILLDRNKMDKILFNLLSNAFKHTPAGGNIKVEIQINEEDQNLVLSVSDSGTGIPEEKRSFLFQRFKQINYAVSGIGIGLHLVSELVNIHHGTIKYDDSEWGGALFRVTIPIAEEMYMKENIIESVVLSDKVSLIEDVDPEVLDKPFNEYKILIIEDDEEIKSFLENQLARDFFIITASDGLSGFNLAIEEQPNLIICDVMMPEMDGFEVTKKLKFDFQTSHIPIILLTAHSSMEHQMEGIEAGADAYIIKPFSTKYLFLRIVKLIEQREKLQHKFSREPEVAQVTICTTSKDREFIEKLHQVIYENLGDADFSVDDFAKNLNLGRTVFYKKVKGLTGYSPNEYIRVIRLKKATEFLLTLDITISEIAYKVGFNDPFYFSRCFKEQFMMTPSQFKEKEKLKTK